MKKLIIIGAMCAALYAAYQNGVIGRGTPPPDISQSAVQNYELLRNAPIQNSLKTPAQSKINLDAQFTATAVADFTLLGRVLSTKHYDSDKQSNISEMDITFGWGPMSNPEKLKDIRIHQRNRWYFWQVDKWVLRREQIEHNSANMHMIPADEIVAEHLRSLEKGEEVLLRGKLVNVKGPDGWYWNSSLTRKDTGEGACEVVYVESIERISS